MAYKTNTNPDLGAGFAASPRKHEITGMRRADPAEAWIRLNQKLVGVMDPKADGDLLSTTSPALPYLTRLNGIRAATSKLQETEQLAIINALSSAIVKSPQSQETLNTLLRIYEKNPDASQILASAKRIECKGAESEDAKLKAVLGEILNDRNLLL